MPKTTERMCQSICPKCGKPMKLIGIDFVNFRYICEVCEKQREKDGK